jgi:hypothetical protein
MFWYFLGICLAIFLSSAFVAGVIEKHARRLVFEMEQSRKLHDALTDRIVSKLDDVRFAIKYRETD